jgi:DNA-binding helix-hairpin-helix protein with protein kinase domain
MDSVELTRCDGCRCAVTASAHVYGYSETLCPECRFKRAGALRMALPTCVVCREAIGTIEHRGESVCRTCLDEESH